MKGELFHIFRNTPFGREIFLQSLYTCKTMGEKAKVLLPEFKQYLMYFEHAVVTLELDDSFLRARDTAEAHARELAGQAGVDVTFLDPREFTASTLPDLPIDFDIMTCPRSMKDMSSKVGLGYIGPKVRALVRHAPFPVLIPAAVFKPFNSLVVFFGGSDYSRRALSVAREMAAKTRLPLSLFTVLENQDEAHYRRILEQEGLLAEIESGHIKWQLAGGQPLREAFYGVPHDALVVAGAFGHGVVRDIVFGSMLEQIQTILPNNLLIVGPQCVHL